MIAEGIMYHRGLACIQVYALERLMRGLGSGRQGARQGFALALTVLLREVPAIPTPWTLASLTTHLKVSSSMKVLNTSRF